MKTYAEQIRDLQNARAAKAARMTEIINKSMAEDRTTDDSEKEEFDTLEQEIKTIDEDLVRLKKLEAINVQGAAPVPPTTPAAGANQTKSASNARTPGITIHVKSSDQEEAFPGQNYTRMVIAKMLAQLDGTFASGIAIKRWGKSNPTLVELIKANEVAGGGTGSGEWGSELVQADTRYTGDFINFLYAQTVYNRLPLRNVPAHVAIKGQDGASTAYWVGESKPIPVTTADFFNIALTPLKVAALAVISVELMRNSTPAAEQLVRDSLINASAQRIDTTFLSTAAAVSGVSPAGILNGVSAKSSAGSDNTGLKLDVKALYADFIAAKNASDLYFVMNQSLAKSIQLMENTLGLPAFPGITANGGTLLGDNVVTGNNVNAAHLILLKPSDIYKIDERGVEVSMSRDAMIEMNSVPTGASDTPVAASATPVSMFQTDSVAIKVVTPINFAKRRASAVQYVSDADYGAVSS